MMRSMRAATKWIMVVVAVAFAGWGVFQVGMDVTGQGSALATDVARVNGVKIDQQSFLARVQQRRDQQRQAGLPWTYTLEEDRALEDAVLEQMVQEILLQEEYRRRGISATDDEVRQALLNAPPQDLQAVPDFQTDGQFDLAKYQRYLQSGVDPVLTLALEAQYRAEIPRYKLFERLIEDVVVSDGKLWVMYRDQRETATVRLATLLPQTAVPDSVVEPTEDEIRAYYRANRDDFRRAPRVFLSFVGVSRLAAPEDTAAALARARRVREELAAGADFAAVAARESADSANRDLGGDLSSVALGDFVPEFERAALALEPGEISEPVLTPFGYHVIELESKSADRYHPRHILIPIEQTEDRMEVADSRADTLDIIAAERDDPDALDHAAEQLGIPLRRAQLAEGTRMVADGDQVPDVDIWAFEAVDGETSHVVEAEHAYYVFRRDSLAPDRIAPLEEVREEARLAARNEKRWEETRALARRIAGSLETGATLDEAASSFGIPTRAVGPFTRIEPPPFLRDAPEAIGEAFGLPLGEVGGPIESDLAIFFVEPTARVGADSVVFAAQADSLRQEVVRTAQQVRVQLALTSLRERANVLDRRRELERALRDLEDLPGPLRQQPGPVGF